MGFPFFFVGLKIFKVGNPWTPWEPHNTLLSSSSQSTAATLAMPLRFLPTFSYCGARFWQWPPNKIQSYLEGAIIQFLLTMHTPWSIEPVRGQLKVCMYVCMYVV